MRGSVFYGQRVFTAMKTRPVEGAIWTLTPVQFLYKHRNDGYHVRTCAVGKEKWKSLRTKAGLRLKGQKKC